MSDRREPTGMEVAIVGMAGRFPGARNVEEFWRNLRDGVESITHFTAEELIARGADPSVVRQPQYVKAAFEIAGHDLFDAAFFGISPREAELIEPQQRLFLECAWEALETAGYDPERLPRRVGTYAGSRFNGYLVNVYSNPAAVASASDLQIQVANDKDYLATRLSYKLNLGGPSMTVQTACSTALVAIHLASQALLNGECDMALAGGVGIRVPEYGYPYTEGEVNAPDARIRAFDAKAKGTIFGSGLGLVVLKRLEDALQDGDTIRALILGSAVTNDGSLKVGFTAPGVDGQARVVRAAQLAAEVEPESISYIEAHGTGTPVGDPIEVAALNRVFRENTERSSFCAIGSVKTNIGHLGAAAGVAGVIKTALALERRTIPPSLFFEEPNPQIDFANSPFYVNTGLSEWKSNGGPRRAGVSAFGMGGTNAHVILEEAPEVDPSDPARPWQLLALSARTSTALERATAQLADHLEAHPELNLADVAYTLDVGRKRFPHRSAFVCRDREEAVEALRNPGGGATTLSDAADRPVAFLFSGQGAQYPGMGADLYETQPTFRAEVDRCSALLEPHLGFDLRDLLVHAEQGEEAGKRLNQTAVTQPALFVLEYCLARLWMEWGVVPRAMMGHSIGEYAAACLAGVFSLPEALALVAARGRLMQSLPSGAMLSVPLTADEVGKMLVPPLSLAAVNSPGRSVVSGPEEAIEAFRRRLEEQGLSPRRLHTSHAFHSEMMEPILAPFVRQFEGIDLQPPQIPYISNVTGTWITDDQATDPGYWARHLRQAVLFADGVRELLAEPGRLLLEVGPGNTLATFALQHPDRSPEQAAVSSLPHARDRQPARRALLKALGQLWLHGAAVDWAGMFADERRLRIPLPTYPFEGERFWIDPGKLSAAIPSPGAPSRNELDDWFHVPFWKPSLPLVLDGDPAPAGGRWLVFLDREGLGERVVERLRQTGQSAVTVEIGEGFTRLGEHAYAVSPARREDYDALMQALAASGELPERIVHLWNVGRRRCEARCPEVLADEKRGFWSLLFLAQACGKHVKSPLRLAAVSNNAQRVAGEEFLCPGKATLLGPVRIIPLEYPHIQAASLDVVLPAAGSTPDEEMAEMSELAEWLLGDMAAGLSDLVVAYRGRGRFLLDYQKVRIPPPAPDRLRFRRGGTYLVTGGLGGLGLVFAEFLAREFQARLSLLGISPLPPREEWDAWLMRHGEHHRVSARIRKVQELEALGAEVLVLAVDVADEGQMRQAIEQTRDRFGDLHGVIHAAGLAGGGLIQLKTVETAARVLAPKIRGTLTLDAALADQPLDFLLLCSSTISILGGLGQVDYCAANSFLDAFAQASALKGGSPVVSINWGAWQEVGMAVAAGLAGEKTAGRRLHPLLDRRQREMAEQTIYETDFGAARQWALAEHRVLGQPTLPGTSYLEMACAAFQDHAAVFERQAGEAGVEIRDALFLTPLRLEESETRTVQTILEPDADGFSFRVVSRAPDGSEEGSLQVHARGKVGPLTPEPNPGRRDLEAIRQRCNEREVVITEPVMMSGEGLVYWGPRWQSLKRADVGAGEILASLELPEDFASDLGELTLHPALLDVATSLMGFLKEGSHLPISYQRLALRRPLGGRIYSHLRERTEMGEGKETVAVDVTLMDESGEVLVEIERFVLKQVTETSTLRRSAGEAKAAPQAPPASPAKVASRVDTSDGILSWEGVEVVRRVLSRGRDLPQVVASAKDIHALLIQIRALDRGSLTDRADLSRPPRASHPRPSLTTPYAAPRTPVEQQLAEAFQQVLGLQEVGIHDNFFDLGGDSIVGIQVVARANEAGLTLSPDQLFENQTIAELAGLITPAQAAPEPQETVEAPTPETAAPFADSGLPPEELAKVLSKLKEMNL